MPGEREDGDLSVKVAVCVCVPARPPDGCQKHHLDARLALDLVDGEVFHFDQVVRVAVFVLVAPFFIYLVP